MENEKEQLSCDACLRSQHTPCFGFPCERCTLYELSCLFLPAQSQLSELRQQFSRLLPPGYIPGERDLQEEVGRGEGLRREGGNIDKDEEQKKSCVACGYLSKTCSKNRPKCLECDEEGLLCVYGDSVGLPRGITGSRVSRAAASPSWKIDADGMDPVKEEREGMLQPVFLAWREACRRELREANRYCAVMTPREENSGKCDTCKVWTAYCDNLHPSCSSCVVRGVDCRYTPSAKPHKKSHKRRTSSSIRESNMRRMGFYDPQPLPQRNQSPKQHPSSSRSSTAQIYHSTPSGCIACFNAKSKCQIQPGVLHSTSPSSSSETSRRNASCQRCHENALQCVYFPTGTKLLSCENCIKQGRVCTNVKEGLRCDGCVESGRECSREQGAARVGTDDEGNLRRDVVTEEEQMHESRSCQLCTKLHQFCDGIEPACALCRETGLSCRYPDNRTLENRDKEQQRDEGAVESMGNTTACMKACGLCNAPMNTTMSHGRVVCNNCGKGTGNLIHDGVALPGIRPTKQVISHDGVSTRRDRWEVDNLISPDSHLKIDRKGKGRVVKVGMMSSSNGLKEGATNREEIKSDDDEEWQQISRDEAFGVLKDGELGIMELD